MIFTEPMPFQEALDAIGRRTPVGSALSSAEWAQMPLALRDRAFFSAKVAEVGFLASARRQVEALASGSLDRASARVELKRLLGSLGADVDEADLTDLRSDARLNLILDTNLAQAQGYGQWLQGQDPDALDAFPAQELIRARDSEEPRDWPARWAAAGGAFHDGRMIALKSDPIWSAISRFGTPYPPFDFNSGMDVVAISRDEAEAIGLLEPGAPVEPQVESFNARLQATLPDATPEVMEGFRDLFGDQVDVDRAGKVTWQGDRIRRLYERALADDDVKWSLNLGQATPSARAKARAAGVELPSGTSLDLDADHIRHADQRHGADETQTDQRPLTQLDVELIPHVWRDPDQVSAGDKPGDLVFEKSILDRLVFATWKPAPKTGKLRLHSLLVKKEGGQP